VSAVTVGGMNVPQEIPPSPLAQAQNQLRAVLKHHQDRDPRGSDTGTLDRMLGHMKNIEKSVSASMQDHVNASKRLKDFADTVERMASRMTDVDQQSVIGHMRALAETLRGASTELSNAGAPPPWASAVPTLPVE
jgi:soluble cytochrome b562